MISVDVLVNQAGRYTYSQGHDLAKISKSFWQVTLSQWECELFEQALSETISYLFGAVQQFDMQTGVCGLQIYSVSSVYLDPHGTRSGLENVNAVQFYLSITCRVIKVTLIFNENVDKM